jgi:integrase
LNERESNMNEQQKPTGLVVLMLTRGVASIDGSLVNPRNFGTRVVKLAERAKLKPLALHCLRDTHASLLASKGVALEVVSKRLGHADIRITAERYLHAYRESDAAAARALDTVPI